MSRIAIIYRSKYGATKQYAEWIAKALNAELLEKSSVKPEDLSKYNIIVYGGGLYASGISGIELVTKNPCQNLVIFTVGLANPETTDYTKILNKNLPVELRSKVKVFHLRGGIDYGEIGPVHRGMMALMKKMAIGNKTTQQLSDEERTFVDTYGKKVNFINQEAILPLVNYVKDQLDA